MKLQKSQRLQNKYKSNRKAFNLRKNSDWTPFFICAKNDRLTRKNSIFVKEAHLIGWV